MTMVKKIQLSMRELFGKWQNSQQTLASKSEAVLVGNCGPVWQAHVKCQLQCQSIFDAVETWADKELNNKVSGLRETATATNMADAPVQIVRLDIIANDAKAAGYRTNWPDQKTQWSLVKGAVVLARGTLDIEKFEMQIEVNTGPRSNTLTQAIKESIASRNRRGRDKHLVSLALTSCSLGSEVCGRVPKSRQEVADGGLRNAPLQVGE